LALQFLDKHGFGRTKNIILSDMVGTSMSDEEINRSITKLLNFYKIDNAFFIGKKMSKIHISTIQCHHFESTEDFLKSFDKVKFENGVTLIKGARTFKFEDIEKKLLRQSHSTTLTIDLAALEHNLATFASLLSKDTSLICVIKAGAYGSGSEEIAKVLQYKGATYLAVAFADEGVHLRKAGIYLPIMVLNPDEDSIESMLHYQLEPEVYDMNQLTMICKYLSLASQKKMTVHLKLDSGMSRLGFKPEHLDEMISILRTNPKLEIGTIFSHLAGSEAIDEDTYTEKQVSLFLIMYQRISDELNIKPKKHILNSSGIHRFPNYQFDYVRLGIGLYGIDPSAMINGKLEKVHVLEARIIQIKGVKKGDAVGYNRKGIMAKDGIIAVLNIGYADGLMRSCGNEKFSVFYRGSFCPIVGNVCMDLTIIDITNVQDASVGHTVEIFGKNNSIENLARACQTIPYEILTRISPRIKRRFII
jgi:alanine racemase